MTWIYYDDTIFNLAVFNVISLVGDYDISLSRELNPDDEDYFVLNFPNTSDRDEAFSVIKSVLSARNL